MSSAMSKIAMKERAEQIVLIMTTKTLDPKTNQELMDELAMISEALKDE